jgi:hypothetical protein
MAKMSERIFLLIFDTPASLKHILPDESTYVKLA